MITVKLYYAQIQTGLFNETEAKLVFTDVKLDGFTRVLTKEYDYADLTDKQVCEMMFMMTNGEGENPLATTERQEFIKKKGLHTSLSIGDIVVIIRGKDKKIYLCKSMGWEELDEKQPNIT